MTAILLCTILGFLAGLAWILKKRGIKPGMILTATFMGLLGAGFLKAIQAHLKNQTRRRYY